ncbi:MAG TPA: hypothetical protein DIC35_04270 [Candidatus Moranbacteria bacterium]|nr:hypothetical protein [Candidatus Moranbacteria bacterium]
MPRKYSPKAQEEVKKAMKEYKKGKLTIGKSKKKVEKREQAVAIGLDQTRRKGGKVPKSKKQSKGK